MTEPDRTLDERDPEANEADATEQATPAGSDRDDPGDEPVRLGPDGPEVSEGDAVEQARGVGPDDDFYR
ncbi:hypothetical protein O7635_10675 [Asanoa sp. WMMD1127]|uniref:hypothetical protein n=1 Tax=Asanoa sp. WMMD1127 TaxID=3016107 RepID=UPI002417DF17|nr:hypothetical protein [Asanoa sp. WMMD1127]MDG4822315.1 hypothetical protein [Asanoa sp. WMMD1127]